MKKIKFFAIAMVASFMLVACGVDSKLDKLEEAYLDNDLETVEELIEELRGEDLDAEQKERFKDIELDYLIDEYGRACKDYNMDKVMKLKKVLEKEKKFTKYQEKRLDNIGMMYPEFAVGADQVEIVTENEGDVYEEDYGEYWDNVDEDYDYGEYMDNADEDYDYGEYMDNADEDYDYGEYMDNADDEFDYGDDEYYSEW